MHEPPSAYACSRRRFLIAATSLASSAPCLRQAIAAETNAERDDVLKVLTCNIRLPLAEDETAGNGWAARRDLCARVITQQNAHLICLQECRESQLEFLLSRLAGWRAVGLAHPDLGFDRVNPILIPDSRFELLTTGGFWLSESPHIEGSKSWDSARARFVNWAQLKDRRSGRQLRVWNTHLDHIGNEARQRQAALIADAAAALPSALPQVLAGDFNAGAEHPAIKTIKAAGWIDTYAAIHGDAEPGFTAHRFLGPRFAEQTKRSRKIDWIFCLDDMKPLAAAILRDQENGRFPSDHYFVSAEVLLPGT